LAEKLDVKHPQPISLPLPRTLPYHLSRPCPPPNPPLPGPPTSTRWLPTTTPAWMAARPQPQPARPAPPRPPLRPGQSSLDTRSGRDLLDPTPRTVTTTPSRTSLRTIRATDPPLVTVEIPGRRDDRDLSPFGLLLVSTRFLTKRNLSCSTNV
jgi:hypothetical protein